VLLRNNEWDYAREFITISEVLDEERREAFLQALQSLQDEQEEVKAREKEEQRYQEEVRKLEDRERRLREEELERDRERGRQSSEHDYGVEDSHHTLSNAKSTTGSSTSKSAPRKPVQSPTSTPRSSKPIAKSSPPSLTTRASNIVSNLRQLVERMVREFRTNPIVLMQFLTFVVAFLMVFGSRTLRARIKRMLGQGWTKVRQTAGMGVKVSYI